MAPDAELLRAYRATGWAVRGEMGRLTLRVGAHIPLPLAELPAAIVTAYNPASRRRSVARNRAANRRLLARLRGAGARWLPARAVAENPRAPEWDEPGFLLLGVDRAWAAELGSVLGQNAIVWIGRDGRAELVATRPGFCGRELGEALPPDPDLPQPLPRRCSSSTA